MVTDSNVAQPSDNSRRVPEEIALREQLKDLAIGARLSRALSITIRTLYLHPELRWWYRSGSDTLMDGQAEMVSRWRVAVRDLGRPKARTVNEYLTGLLETAQRHLEAAQDALEARWAEVTSGAASGWQDAPQAARDLYAAVMARSREAGPEVLLSDRVAVDLIESMTGRRYMFGRRPGLTRAKRWLTEHGYLTTKSGRLRTTIYCLLTQGIYPPVGQCLVSVGQVSPGRPGMSEQDRAVVRQSVADLEAKRWEPGRALTAVREDAADRAAREAAIPSFGELMTRGMPPGGRITRT